MQIRVRCGCDATTCPEWAIVELQGVVESQPSVGAQIQNLEIGRLCHDQGGSSYTFTVGYHELTGTKVPLKKPVLVLKKRKELGDLSGVELEVVGIIRQKILFKNRPKALISNGSIPSIKLFTYRRRLGSVSEITREEANSQAVPSLRRNMSSEFSCMIKEARALGLALGIPCLDGLEEGEAQCALLNSAYLCDGCFSSDSDIFLFGAKTVYRDIILGEGGHVICYEMADIERKLGSEGIHCDYSQGVRGFGPETACRLVKSIGDDKVLLRVKSEGLAFARKSKSTKKATKDLNSDANKENEPCYAQCCNSEGQNAGSCDQLLQVINAYMKPKCHSPDSDAVQRVCTQHPFVRMQLQQICKQYFDWSPDKTDEYILPKIAERDLRRFANLRSSSSKLGVRIPLNEMPVLCPVSAIVKRRKALGRDCFEVSWREMQGLRTSIVPADLVESACTEKIVEFMERKCEGNKKQNNRRPRPRKSTKADVGEVDLQLKGLMLSLDSQNNSPVDATKNCEPKSLHNIMKSDSFIDLLSPSPPLRACKLAKHRVNVDKDVDVIDICESETNNIDKCVDIIDICESETISMDKRVDVIDVCASESDVSPEHEKKARELRFFISSIREDLY